MQSRTDGEGTDSGGVGLGMHSTPGLSPAAAGPPPVRIPEDKGLQVVRPMPRAAYSAAYSSCSGVGGAGWGGCQDTARGEEGGLLGVGSSAARQSRPEPALAAARTS